MTIKLKIKKNYNREINVKHNKCTAYYMNTTTNLQTCIINFSIQDKITSTKNI